MNEELKTTGFNIPKQYYKEIIKQATITRCTRFDRYYADKNNYKYIYYIIYRKFMEYPDECETFVFIPYITEKSKCTSYLQIFITCVADLNEYFSKVFDMSFLENKLDFAEMINDNFIIIKGV